MRRTVLGLAIVVLIAAAIIGCASLATPEAPGTASPAAGGAAAPEASQQVKDGATLYVQFSCVRCHAADGTGGVPNQLNVGGDDTIPPLNNAYREKGEEFTNSVQITDVLMTGDVITRKPGVINMPSWKGVMSSEQADAIAAFILADFPHVGPEIDFNVAKASDIYVDYSCITCHGQVGDKGVANPLASGEKEVPGLRNAEDDASLAEFRDYLMDGSVPKGKKGVLFMPAWGQILSTQQMVKIMAYIEDGLAAKKLPAPPEPEPLLSPGSSSQSGSASASASPSEGQ